MVAGSNPAGGAAPPTKGARSARRGCRADRWTRGPPRGGAVLPQPAGRTGPGRRRGERGQLHRRLLPHRRLPQAAALPGRLRGRRQRCGGRGGVVGGVGGRPGGLGDGSRARTPRSRRAGRPRRRRAGRGRPTRRRRRHAPGHDRPLPVRHAPIRAGPATRPLVHAAAGGIGLLLVQMLAGRGDADASRPPPPRRRRRWRATPAPTSVVRYTRPTWSTEVARITDGPRRRRRLRRRGRDHLRRQPGLPAAPRDAGALRRRPAGRCRRSTRSGCSGAARCSSPGRRWRTTSPTARSWSPGRSAVLGAVADGSLDVRIGGRYPLAEAGRAHATSRRRTTGKLLVVP